MSFYRASEVFVPGGLPQLTYVSRAEGGLERQLRASTENSSKLVTVTGPTKSGKTVLSKRVLSSRPLVWIDGGAVNSEEEFWVTLASALDAVVETTTQTTGNLEVSVEIEASGQLKIPLIAQSEVGGRTGGSAGLARTTSRTTSSNHKAEAIRRLSEGDVALVVDDFHYLAREIQGAVVRALKAPIFNGVTVVFIAIPHRRYDAIRVEREMTARVEQIHIKPWNTDELLEIPHKGFGLLNVAVSARTLALLANEALGSPHLMQDFCKQLCFHEEIDATQEYLRQLEETDTTKIFKGVAAGMNKIAFDRLARGPSAKTDRRERLLKDGRRVDIYEAILEAIASLRPGSQSLDYEDIRAALRTILDEAPPRAHEVSRVLDYMSKISASDESSATIIDWDKESRRLHVTDPFFAFFLKWGLDEIRN